MKDKILEILIDKIKATPHDFYPTGIEGLPQSAREIADMVQKFVEWKDKYVYYVPRYQDTDSMKIYLYVWWDGLEVKNRHESYFNYDELFTYWHKNIYNIKDTDK